MCAYVLADEDGTFGGGAPNLDARKVAAFASEKARQLRELRSNGACPSPKRTGLRLPGAPFDARAEDAVRNDAKEERAKKTEDWAPTLVLVPLVLGIDRHVNARYVPSVAATLRVKQSLGVLGGTPGSSLYVVGAQDDRLFYLDPHTVFPFAESRNAERFEIADVSTYACDDALHMDARELDPSMVLGFYCRARGDLDELCLELELLQRRAGAAPLITVASARDVSNGASREWKPVGAKTPTAPEPTRGSQSELSRRSSREEETEARGAESEDDEWEFL
jgi:cysteine protease ATG4